MTKVPPYQSILKEILIDEAALQKRVAELGVQISNDYENENNLILICILRGGVMFLTDLMRHITVPNAIDFMSVSSYGAGSRESSGTVRITLDLRTDIADRNVILVEDIVDSGHTLQAVTQMLQTRQPKSLKVCTLLDKSERREVEVPINYIGFSIPDKFVFGYGLDIDEYYRNLPFIGVVDTDVFLT
ncbi:MAG: hypoxanthine phosphoribosyltransferase [Anaerolineales bacterium]|nr:hypoxanthine phosphoribosyltransferase [Anaerolineales bacterium]